MNPASLDIANMLIAESEFGLTFAQNIFIGKEPAQPNDCVTIFDTPGQPDDLTLGGKADPPWSRPSVAIRVRNTNYLDGWTLINQIKDFLHGVHGEVWGGSTYALINSMGSPHLHDWDENGRVRFLALFNLQRTT